MPLITDATGNDLTYRIIGAAMEVHNEIGYGFKEEVYEKALEVKLNHADIKVERQYQMAVEYEGEQVAIFYMDLFVESQVVVEVKAFSHQLTNDELAQVINYLKATGAPVGLLFNFGRRKLEYRRVFPAKDMKSVQRIGRDDVLKPNAKITVHEWGHEYSNEDRRRVWRRKRNRRRTRIWFGCVEGLHATPDEYHQLVEGFAFSAGD